MTDLDNANLGGYYWKHPEEKENVVAFDRLMQRNRDVTFYRPSPAVAPWHWQAIIEGVTLNFWPHKAKVQRDGEKARTGTRAMQQLIDSAKEESDFHVID